MIITYTTINNIQFDTIGSITLIFRRRYVYSFDCKNPIPGLNIPMVVDCTGIYFRREGLGGKFIAGFSPAEEIEPPKSNNNEVDCSFFDQAILPTLTRRVPAFNNVKVSIPFPNGNLIYS